MPSFPFDFEAPGLTLNQKLALAATKACPVCCGSGSGSGSGGGFFFPTCCSISPEDPLSISYEIRGCDCSSCLTGSFDGFINFDCGVFGDETGNFTDVPCAFNASVGIFSTLTCYAGGPLPDITYASAAGVCCLSSLIPGCSFLAAGGYLNISEGLFGEKGARYSFITARFIRASCNPLYIETDWFNPVRTFVSTPPPSCVCTNPQMRVVFTGP